MLNNNGYVLIDALIAATVVLMLISTVVPMTSLLLTEREVLSERRHISSQLHDKLQLFISDYDRIVPSYYTNKFKSKDITFEFEQYNEFIVKGCAVWENLKNQKEEVCLYGNA